MQDKVKNFNGAKTCHKKPMPVYARILNIQSELGELGKEYLKHSRYGTQEFELTDEFAMELGDCLYSLLSLANEVNLDANKCLDAVLDKYKKRMERSNSMGSESNNLEK